MTPVKGTLLLALATTVALGAGAAEKAESAKAKARTRVVRTWLEPVTVKGVAAMNRITYVFDYDAGVFSKTVQDAAGQTLESKTYAPGEIEVAPSKVEIAEAFEMVRSDPEFSRILDNTNGQLMGGFGLDEKAGLPCGPGARCIHVQINSEDGWGLVRWAVVDLAKSGFAYRSYRPEMSEGVGK
jgi:phage-related tail fiber protein